MGGSAEDQDPFWIIHLLAVTFGSSSAPVIGKIFVWGLVVVALMALAWFIYREMRRNARLETIMPEVLPVSAKQWRIWMEEAQAAAAKGLWRDAVHLAYWGGISFLEENGRGVPTGRVPLASICGCCRTKANIARRFPR